MASSGIDAGSATFPHAPDEIADLSLVQSIPFFLKEADKAFTVQRVAPVHSSSQNVPHVFNWAHIGRIWWSLQYIHVILIQEFHCTASGVGTCIVLLKE